MTATPSAIRARLVTVVEALTPTRQPKYKFRRSDPRTPFPEWVAKNSGKVRSFDVQSVGTGIEGEHLHSTTLVRDQTYSIMVAYPRLPDLAGAGGLDGLRDMMREDATQIRDAVFSPDNYLSGVLLQTPPVASFSEDGEVWFAVLDTTVKFYEAQSL